MSERHPGLPCAGTVAIVKPVRPPARTGLSLDDVWRWLWEANQGPGERKVTRGQRNAGPPGIAVVLVMGKGKCDRKTAEAAIDKLEELGRVKIDEFWEGSRFRRVVVAEQPPPAAEDGDDIPY